MAFGCGLQVPRDPLAPFVGDWESEPVLSQLGTAVYRLSLRPDSTFELSADMKSMRELAAQQGKTLPPITSSGTFRIEGNTITFSKPAKPSVDTFRFEGGCLILTEHGRETYRYHRR